MDLVGTLAVMMLIRTALFFKHRAGCHVPYAVAMVSIRGHSSVIHLYKLIRLRCSACVPSLFLSLFEEMITRNMKTLLFFLTMFNVLAAVLPFILSKINTAKKTTTTSLLNTTKQAQHFKCDTKFSTVFIMKESIFFSITHIKYLILLHMQYGETAPYKCILEAVGYASSEWKEAKILFSSFLFFKSGCS